MTRLDEGTRVRVNRRITDSGEEGDPDAKLPDGAFIHAEPGELATIDHVQDHGDGEYAYNLEFDRTGTTCITHPEEFEVVNGTEKPN